MNKTEKFLIDTLAVFVGNNKIELDTDGVDRDRLLALSKDHGVTGIVGYIVKQLDLFENEAVRDRFLYEYDRTVMKMSVKEYGAETVCKMLRDNDIPHILFKGTTVSTCYPVRELRTFGDVDILIHDADRDKATKLMKACGFSYRIEDDGVVNSFSKGQEKYEIHTKLNIPSSEEESFKDHWSLTRSLNGSTLAFEHNFHLSFLISHIEKHLRGSGAGVRMYLDIALYLKKYGDEIDFAKVRDRLASCGLDKMLDTVLYVCKRWFGTEAVGSISSLSDEAYERFCSLTVNGGVFGEQELDGNIKTAVRSELSNGKKGARLRLFMSRAFPSKTELMRMYPPRDNERFSPFSAWLRHTGNVFRKKKLSRIKEIATLDVSSAEDKREFLSSLGCIK